MGGAACPQDAFLATAPGKRVEDNALHHEQHAKRRSIAAGAARFPYVRRYDAPFTSMIAPVIDAGASRAQKTTVRATSPAVATRPSG